MRIRTLTIALVGIPITFASGACSSSSGGASAGDAGTSEAGSGSSSGGDSGSSSGGTPEARYCVFQTSGAERCVGYGGLSTGDCNAVHGAIVSSCPSGGRVGCCGISPDYQECWYCPSDPTPLQTACETIRPGLWTAGTTCGDAGDDSGSGSGGSSGGSPEAGGSPYDTACSSSSMTCPGTPLVCQNFTFGGGAIST